MSEPDPDAAQTTNVTTRPAPEVVRATSMVPHEQRSGVGVAVGSSLGGTAAAAATALTLNALGLTGAAFWGAFAVTMALAIATVFALLRRARPG